MDIKALIVDDELLARDEMKYLLKDKDLVYEYDELYKTPLHWCIINNKLFHAKLLIEYGADIEA